MKIESILNAQEITELAKERFKEERATDHLDVLGAALLKPPAPRRPLHPLPPEGCKRDHERVR